MTRPRPARPLDPSTPVVVAARRTAVATVGKGLARYDVVGLAAPVLAALDDDVRALGIQARVDDVILGNCLGPGGNPARVAALAAGLGLDVPGLTVDRQCGSGQEAIHLASAQVTVGSALVLAGGVESASTAPWRMRRPATPIGMPELYDRAPFAPSEIGDPDMGEAAENVARVAGISRQRQDEYAARSHERTLASRADGVFDSEFVAVGSASTPGADDRPRRIGLATLSRLPAAFVPDGTVTAGNSCGISDGAAAVAVVPEAVRAAAEAPGLAIKAWVRVGGDPNLPGMCAAPAIEAVLARCGVPIQEVGAIEVTEAFASQLLATTDALGLDPLGADADRVCAQGGAIALGHPWGASGALLAVRLFSRMVRENGPRFGVAACAIGGGQGVAMLCERVGR
ncbi:MAG: thiolase family protein [Dermatophilus congolensis]|nr:thiolase family protein [Dermatophilus congolensis]